MFDHLNIYNVVAAVVACTLLARLILGGRIRSILEPQVWSTFYSAMIMTFVVLMTGIGDGWYVFLAFALFGLGTRLRFLREAPRQPEEPARCQVVQGETPVSVDWILHRFSTPTVFSDSFIYVAVTVCIIGNVMLGVTKGFPLFSDDAASKVATFEGGGGVGIVRRINWALLPLIIVLLTVRLRVQRRASSWVLMIPLLAFLVLSGSKSAFLILILALGATDALLAAIGMRSRANRWLVPFVLIIGVCTALFVLWRTSEGSGGILVAFGTRLLFYGDMNIYLFDSSLQSFLATYGPADFFKYLANPLLGMLRLAEYMRPLGAILVAEYRGDVGDGVAVGPNSNFYAIGLIFFGLIGGCFFSLVTGWLYGALRRLCLSRSVTSVDALGARAYLYVLLPTLILDPFLFLGIVFDSLLLAGACLVLAILVDAMLREVGRQAVHATLRPRERSTPTVRPH